jgi:hypothetical protein
MAFCSKCGASLDPNSQFCPSCGAPVSTSMSTSSSGSPPTVPSPAPSYSPGPASSMQRPTGVTILAVLAGLGGLVLIGFGLIFTLFGFGLIFVVFGLLELGVVYGYWTGASWAWWLGIIVSVLDILSIVTFDVIGLIIGLIMLYYLTRPHVKTWFHRT